MVDLLGGFTSMLGGMNSSSSADGIEQQGLSDLKTQNQTNARVNHEVAQETLKATMMKAFHDALMAIIRMMGG